MYKAPWTTTTRGARRWYAARSAGPADLRTLNEGLRYLFKELREAQTAFVGGSHLDGVYLALVAIYAFVSLFRAAGTEGLMVPLMELESALCALDNGVTEPLLKPVRRAKSGRAPASQLRQPLNYVPIGGGQHARMAVFIATWLRRFSDRDAGNDAARVASAAVAENGHALDAGGEAVRLSLGNL